MHRAASGAPALARGATLSWSVWAGYFLCSVVASVATAVVPGAPTTAAAIPTAADLHPAVTTLSARDVSGVGSWLLTGTGAHCVCSTLGTPAGASVRPTRRRFTWTCRCTAHYWDLPEQAPGMAVLSWLLAWVQSVVRAVVAADGGQLERLALQALKSSPDRDGLAATGAGFLINDQAVWRKSTEKAQSDAALAAAKWKNATGSVSTKVVRTHPLGRSFTNFEKAVTSMLATLRLALPNVQASVLEQAISLMVVSGFDSVESIDRAEVSDFANLSSSPAVLAAMRGAIAFATENAEQRRQEAARKRKFSEAMMPTSGVMASASDVADSVTPAALAEADKALEVAMCEAGLDGIENAAPAKAIAAWANAKACGKDVFTLLEMKRKQMLAEPLRKNGASIAAGCRKYHHFAHLVLGVPAACTLPPASACHAMLFMAIFRNGATAANYINHLVAACKSLGLSLSWHDDAVAAAKVAARARTERLALPGDEAPVLSLKTLQELVRYCDGIGDTWRGTLYLVFWRFLLRVQSEGVPLEFGIVSEIKRLPPGRHSAVVAFGKVLGLRLNKRKHRQAGSFLQSPCICKESGAVFCVFHRVVACFGSCGTRLSVRTSYEVLKEFRSDLAACNVSNAMTYTLKAFRSGCATDMASKGESLAAILMAGEWRSSALLKYISETELDKQKFLCDALAEEDED